MDDLLKRLEDNREEGEDGELSVLKDGSIGNIHEATNSNAGAGESQNALLSQEGKMIKS